MAVLAADVDGLSSSLGVDRAVSSVTSMVPGGEGCRRRGVMDVDAAVFFSFFVDRLEGK